MIYAVEDFKALQVTEDNHYGLLNDSILSDSDFKELVHHYNNLNTKNCLAILDKYIINIKEEKSLLAVIIEHNGNNKADANITYSKYVLGPLLKKMGVIHLDPLNIDVDDLKANLNDISYEEVSNAVGYFLHRDDGDNVTVTIDWYDNAVILEKLLRELEDSNYFD